MQRLGVKLRERERERGGGRENGEIKRDMREMKGRSGFLYTQMDGGDCSTLISSKGWKSCLGSQ
jgi:hypothetical protein